MKKFCVQAFAVTLGWLGLNSVTLGAATTTSNMVMNIQLSGIVQKMVASTNGEVVTTSYTTSTLKVANSDILTLIQSEFGVVFPTGAQLGYDLQGTTGLVVIDHSGGLIQQVSTNAANPNYVFCLSNSVTGISLPQIITGKAVVNNTTDVTTENVSETIPDYGIFFRDSHGNSFHFDGLLTLKANAIMTSSNTTYKTASITMSGGGGGTIFNAKDGKQEDVVFTKAKVTIAGKNLVQPE